MNMTTLEIIDNAIELLQMLRERATMLQTVERNNDDTVDFMMTRIEAANFIGKSARQFDRMRVAGYIKEEHVNGRIMFRRSELLRYKGLENNIGGAPGSTLEELRQRFLH